MVGIGSAFIALTLFSLWKLKRKSLFETRWLLWIFVVAVVPAVVANQAGWVAAEVGRQPWIVHPSIIRNDVGDPLLDSEGFIQYERTMTTMPDGSEVSRYAGLRTEDGVSKAVKAEHVAASIVMFLFVYVLLGAVWIYVLNKKIQHGPDDSDPPDSQKSGGPQGGSGLVDAAKRGQLMDSEASGTESRAS